MRDVIGHFVLFHANGRVAVTVPFGLVLTWIVVNLKALGARQLDHAVGAGSQARIRSLKVVIRLCPLAWPKLKLVPPSRNSIGNRSSPEGVLVLHLLLRTIFECGILI